MVLEWDDAVIELNEAQAEDILPDNTAINFTCGWLLHETKKNYTLVMDIEPADGSVRYSFTIPRGMVRKVHRTGTTICHLQSQAEPQP